MSIEKDLTSRFVKGVKKHRRTFTFFWKSFKFESCFEIAINDPKKTAHDHFAGQLYCSLRTCVEALPIRLKLFFLLRSSVWNQGFFCLFHRDRRDQQRNQCITARGVNGSVYHQRGKTLIKMCYLGGSLVETQIVCKLKL